MVQLTTARNNSFSSNQQPTTTSQASDQKQRTNSKKTNAHTSLLSKIETACSEHSRLSTKRHTLPVEHKDEHALTPTAGTANASN